MLTIQIGQCGNQLGHSLFSFLSDDINLKSSSSADRDYSEESSERWFSGCTKDKKRIARAVLIDTEKKVINKVQSSSEWAYRPSNLIYESAGGSANNWAYGYAIRGPHLKENIVNAVRNEAEKSDHLQGILVLQSSAGGTGSGVGSFAMEQLRDEFPTKTIISSVVLPFSSGEVATQNYNTLLSLAKLSELADVAVLFENKQIYAICTNVLKNSAAQLRDINDVISKKLSAIFGPVAESRYSIHEVVSFVSSHPAYKFATVKSTPYVAASISAFESSYKWKTYVQHLKQTLRVPLFDSELVDAETRVSSLVSSGRASQIYCKSIANVLVTRGSRSQMDPVAYAEFEDDKMYPDWLSKHDRFAHLHENCTLQGQEKFAALLTNNSQIHKPIDAIVDKAWTAYVHSAFLHQYRKFNVEDDDFLQAFAKVENVVKSYKDLAKC